MQERPVAVGARIRGRPPSSPLEEWEQVYLRNVDVLMGYFARRWRDATGSTNQLSPALTPAP
jgi:hypothetical protein